MDVYTPAYASVHVYVRVRPVAVMVVAVALLWDQSFDNRHQLGPENPTIPALAFHLMSSGHCKEKTRSCASPLLSVLCYSSDTSGHQMCGDSPHISQFWDTS